MDKAEKAKHVGRVSQSILNGVVGDYLKASNNPLGIEMDFYHQYRRLNLNSELSSQIDMPLSNKVIVFAHGLTNLESVWDIPCNNDLSSSPFSFGSLLQHKIGFTPFFLRYNTGLSIAENGELFSQKLDELFSIYPIDIDELVIVGYSMGGLISRYAQDHALNRDSLWLAALSKCIYLGTPHNGAPLEKFGTLVERALAKIPLDYVTVWADWVAIRSTGINDLKDGLRFFKKAKTDDDIEKGYCANAKHYFIGSTVNGVAGKLFGDGLVRPSSSIPASAPEDCKSQVFEGISHMELPYSLEVYKLILEWIQEVDNDKPLCYFEHPSNLVPQNRPLHQTNSDIKNKLKGVLDLKFHTLQKVFETTERMHKSIAKQPFSILKKIPLVKEISRPVEVAHDGVADMVYASLNHISKSASSALK